MNAIKGLKQCWIVLRKELMDWLRDRGSISGLSLQAIVSPIIWVAITLIAANRMAQSDLVLPVAGVDHAPALVDWLNAQIDVEVVPAPPDPAAAVQTGTFDVVLVIPAEFPRRMADGLTAPLELLTDGSAGASRRAADRVGGLIQRYGTGIGSLRLMARGIAPGITSPVRLDTLDLSPAELNQGGFAVFVPILLLWMALFGGLAIATDSTLGERERASLEPLLLNPVSRTALLAGKWLAAATLACAFLLSAGLATLVILRFVPWHEYGLQLLSSDRDLLTVLILMLPLALFWTALVTFLSTVSRSQQQAQTYGGLLMMAVVLTAMASFMFPLPNVPWLGAVPIFGQMTLSVDLLGGGHPAAYRYLLTACGAVLPALALVAAAARLLRRESIVFRS
jgi:sodium transport system permease protein